MSRFVLRRTYVRASRIARGKRCKSCYVFWPEQARPRRVIPLTTAVGGLAMVIVCAVAFYCIVTGLFSPVSTQEVFERTVVEIPIYATASAPAAQPLLLTMRDPSAALDSGRSQRSRSRSSAPVRSHGAAHRRLWRRHAKRANSRGIDGRRPQEIPICASGRAML
jgi:hypothetical protein